MLVNISEVLFLKSVWITIAGVGVYLYLKLIVFSYWNWKKVPHVPPNVLLGNINKDFVLNKVTIGDLVKKYYDKFQREKYFGIYIFHNPILVINDLELIRLILVKDFRNFYDRGIHSNIDVDPMSFNLFRLTGKRWKNLRTKLTPIFTSGKLKQLYPLLYEVSHGLVNICDKSLQQTYVIDMKDLVERFITDCISNVAFGFNCNSLKDPDNEFRNNGKSSTDMEKYAATLSIFCSNILDFLQLRVFSRGINNFFIRIFEDVVNHRVKNKVERKDFINLLTDLTNHEQRGNNKVSLKDESGEDINNRKLNMLEAAAQVFVFFVAGFETTSTTVTYCLHELAKHPEVQEKLQEEIDQAADSPEGFNYENIMNMKYLDMTFNETLRKHPPVPFVNRLCTNDYRIPGTDLRIPKGMRLAISVSGLHMNPDIYHEPEKVEPLRFSKENLSQRSAYCFLPFGEGPRTCIAKRIALLQGKLALATLLSKYTFSICDKTPVPLAYSNRTFLTVAEKNLYLKLTKRYRCVLIK